MRSANPAVAEELEPCESVRELASEFLEDELDAPSAGAVGQHLRRCPECLRFYAELALTILAMHDLGPRLALTHGRLAGPNG